MEQTPKKEETNLMALISYLGVLCLIPILTKEKDEFVRFHAKQGLVLFIGEMVTWAVLIVLPFLWLVGNLLGLFWLILSVLGIINVIKKEKKEIPLVGQLAEKIKI